MGNEAMTNLDTERAKFESWVLSEGIDLVLIKVSDADDRYLSPNTCKAYRAWLARSEAEGWRPIADAPVAETVICYHPMYGRFPAFQRFVMPGATDTVWVNEYNGDAGIMPPTHWQPLPAPPKEDGE